MKLDHISAVLRPRQSAEAVDLGLAMVRRHAPGIYRAWLLFVLPLWGVLGALLHDYPSVLFAVVWWLKPLYDRIVLFYIGRSLFGEAPSLREQLREWPRLLTRRLGLSLLWGRLSGVRSFTMPVVVLEGLTGPAYESRTAILKRHGGGAAMGFMQLFLLLELAVIFGLWTGIREFLPEEALEWMQQIQIYVTQGGNPPPSLLWSLTGCYLVAVALLEPFYAGGGFGLYINTRTHLEGWDVDLAFRQLAGRLRARLVPPMAALLVLGLFLGSMGNGQAADDPKVERDQAEQQIKEVMAHPDFKEHVEKYMEWVRDNPSSSPSPAPAPSPEPQGWDWSWINPWLHWVGGLFSGDWWEVALRLLAVAAVAGLVGWLGWWCMKRFRQPGWQRLEAPRDRGPKVVMGLQTTPESLPPDVPSAAWMAWQQGDQEGAVRLLYRGALTWLIGQAPGPVRESDTEGDCLRHASHLPEGEARRYFSEITATWMACAYGRTLPPAGLMQGLCGRWPFAAHAAGLPGAKPAGPAFLILLLIGMLPALTGCGIHREEKERTVGYIGEARRDPWLAATRFLEMNDFHVVNQRGVLDLPSAESVMIVPAAALQTGGPAKQVLAWVRRGGHLIYLAEGGDSYLNDWSSPDYKSPVNPVLHPLVNELGIKLKRDTAADPVKEVLLQGDIYQVKLHEEIRFDVSAAVRKPDLLAGPPAGASLVSLRQGTGRVTLLSHAGPLRNRYIAEDGNAALLLALVEQTGEVGSVYFIKAGRVSLWDMLMQHAWPVMLALLVLLVFWLWRVLPRFGPIRALQQRRELRFVTHLEEAGAYFWHHGLTDALLEAPRQAVFTAARRRALRQEEQQFLALVAEHSHLPEERVKEALFSGGRQDARAFTSQMADLQQILHRLTTAPLPPGS